MEKLNASRILILALLIIFAIVLIKASNCIKEHQKAESYEVPRISY